MTAQERAMQLLMDYSVRHQINLSRYGNGTVQKILAMLNKADGELLDKITKRGEEGTFSGRRMTRLLEEIRQIVGDNYRTAHDRLREEMTGFAQQESDVTAAMLQKVVPVKFDILTPTAEQLVSILDDTPIMVGPDRALLLEETFSTLAAGKESAIRGAIRLGMIEGETVPQIVRRLQGSRASRYTDGIFEKDRRNAEAIVRTVVNHTSNQAVQLTYHANKDLVKGWEFLATLDGRTTITCASLNGREFPIGQGPIPPRHIRCRSFSIPAIKSWKELGIDLPELPPAVRASKDGPVSADLSFSDWLRGQDLATQVDILGATRAKLFRDGGLTVDRFTDNAGIVYDLKELKARQEAAFKRVFGA